MTIPQSERASKTLHTVAINDGVHRYSESITDHNEVDSMQYHCMSSVES